MAYVAFENVDFKGHSRAVAAFVFVGMVRYRAGDDRRIGAVLGVLAGGQPGPPKICPYFPNFLRLSENNYRFSNFCAEMFQLFCHTEQKLAYLLHATRQD